MQRRKCVGALLGVVGLACLPVQVQAQSGAGWVDMSGKPVRSQDIVDALQRQQAVRRTRTRRIQLNPQEGQGDAGAGDQAVQQANQQTNQQTAQPDTAPQTESVRLNFDQITFAFDSAELSGQASAALDEIGRALASPKLGSLQFLIEGHTDLKGGLDYNMRLSVRRADAVRQYLVARHSLDPQRLFIAGKGPTELLNRADPFAGVNRRVVLQAFNDGVAVG